MHPSVIPGPCRRTTRAAALLVLLLALSRAGSAPAAARNASTDGYLEYRQYRLWDASETSGALARVRPSWREELGRDLALRVTGELRAVDRAFELPGLAGADQDEGSIERAYLEWKGPRDTVVAGRQAVTWGSGLFFNPTEPYPELHLFDYWYERSPVDGVRVTHALGDRGELQAVAAARDEWEERATAVRFLRTGRLDWALSYVRDELRDQDRMGLDLKGDLGVGWWFEGARVEGALEDHEEWVLGVDYTFDVRKGLYVALQAYEDGSGAGSTAAYDWAALVLGHRRTLADRYTTATVRLAATSRWTYSLDVIRNEVDGTRVVTPHAEVKVGGDTELHVGVNLPGGDRGGEFRPEVPGGVVDVSPDATLFAWMRVHF